MSYSISRFAFWISLLAITTNVMIHMEQVVCGQEDEVDRAYKTKVFESETGKLPYRILAPLKTEDGKKYPLVIVLHGAGERGNDNNRQLKHGADDFLKRQPQYPAYVVFPQCPEKKRWVEADWSKEDGANSFPAEPSESMAKVLELIEQLKRDLPVDSQRLYVTGLSMGGYGTWFLGAKLADQVAAIAPICGGGDPTWAKQYHETPVWVFHGGADEVVPFKRSREMVCALVVNGQQTVRYDEYPGVGHNSWAQTFARDDFFRWLFEQKR